MRLATFNMRGGGSPAHWRYLLAGFEPDLVFAQESRDPAGYPADVFGGPDPREALWRPVGHGRWGSAILAPGAEVVPVTLDPFHGWVVGAAVRMHGLEILAFGVHLPPTTSSYLRSAHHLLDALAPLVSQAPLVLAGDWNLTCSPRDPGDPIPIRRGEVDLLARIADEFGLVSAWSAAHPGSPLPQTLRWTRDPAYPFHCDGIFLPREWAPALRDVRVPSGPPWTALSDHHPVVADLDLTAFPAAPRTVPPRG